MNNISIEICFRLPFLFVYFLIHEHRSLEADQHTLSCRSKAAANGTRGACLPHHPLVLLLGTGTAVQLPGVWEVYTAYCDCCWLLQVPLRWQQGQEVFVGWKWSKISIDLQLSIILSAGGLPAQMFKLHKTTQPSHFWLYRSDEEALSSVVTQGFSSFFQGRPAYPGAQVSGHAFQTW